MSSLKSYQVRFSQTSTFTCTVPALSEVDAMLLVREEWERDDTSIVFMAVDREVDGWTANKVQP